LSKARSALAKGSTTLDHMWYGCGAVAVMALSLGCSDSAPERPAPTQEMPNTPAPGTENMPLPMLNEPAAGAAGLALAIDGWTEEIGAKAQLNVMEGVDTVHLAITGGGVRDLLMLDVDFDGLDSTMGPHELEVGYPYGELESALASLGDVTYHSQTGHIAVTLTAEGGISGSFDVALAEDPEFVAGAPLVFEPSDELRILTGRFNGRWQLLCQSRRDGHSSYQVGGEFCKHIEF
jgi:hypothetical protein